MEFYFGHILIVGLQNITKIFEYLISVVAFLSYASSYLDDWVMTSNKFTLSR